MDYKEKYEETLEKLKAQINLNYALIKTNEELDMLNKILITREIEKIDKQIF